MPSLRSPRLRQVVSALLLVGLLLLLVSVTGRARLEPADFTFNNHAEISTLDPATVTGVPEGRVLRAVFEGLVTKDPATLEPRPGMAERWELSDDGLTYTFHLRPEARWTSGDPVTAHDFVWSWERFLNPTTGAQYAYQLWYARGAREYSRLPDGRDYAADPGDGLWSAAVEGAPGRRRVGATGFRLEGAEGPVRPLVAEGERVEAGAPLVEGPWGVSRAPHAGRVAAVREPAPAAALHEDPYEAGWLVELEADAAALAEARAAGRLLDGPAYRREVAWPELVGIRAADERTLVVELEAPTPYFLSLVGFYPLFPVNPRNLEEARERWPDTWEIEWLRPENLVTNGPFRVGERRINDRIRLVKNPDYWDAENVAFDTIDVLAVEHTGTSLNLYLTGEVGWINQVPANLIPRLLEREDFDPTPYLGSYFYRVNVTEPPLDDRRVREALALTIDRRAITEKITKAGQQPAWGYVPPGMVGYEPVEMDHAPVGERYEAYDEAFARDVARAEALFAEAGFGPGGKTFPTIEIHYNTNETHRDVAEVVADGWKRHLGVPAKLLNQEWKVYLDTQSGLDYEVSRSAWIGDYPDPNTFLDMFVTGGENNKTGWGDPRYDALIEAAAAELDPEARMALLREAEEILLEELPVLPIYYYVTQNMVNPRLGGFHGNLQDEHWPKHFYWRSDEELARLRAARDDDQRTVDAPGPAAGLHPPSGRPYRPARPD